MTKKTVNVVAAAIFDNENKIFCALRAENMSLPNYWEFPGGKIEQGEQPEEALKREIEEELTCIINVGKHIHTHLHEYETVNVNLAVYEASIESGTIVLKEHAEGKWLPISDLKALSWAPADIPAIHKIIEHHHKED